MSTAPSLPSFHSFYAFIIPLFGPARYSIYYGRSKITPVQITPVQIPVSSYTPVLDQLEVVDYEPVYSYRTRYKIEALDWAAEKENLFDTEEEMNVKVLQLKSDHPTARIREIV